MMELYFSETGIDGDRDGDVIELYKNDIQSWSLHVIWASSLAGSLEVYGSNDPNDLHVPRSSGNWVDISARFTTIPTISGASGVGLIDGTLGGFALAYLGFTHSGNGDLTVYKHEMRRLNVR